MIEILPGIQSTASALAAEKTRMDVIASNIANANTTRAEGGKPYQRQVVVFEQVLKDQLGGSQGQGAQREVRVAEIKADGQPPKLVYNPGHPDADAAGMVALPNINVHHEMVDLISASRAYEANLAAVKTAKTMALETLRIGHK